MNFESFLKYNISQVNLLIEGKLELNMSNL